MSNRVTHFEIHADDVERAKHFYTSVFGWTIEKWAGMEYWIIMTAEKGSTEAGINGGLLKRPVPTEGNGANAYVCTIQVENIDDTIAKVEASGGTLAMEKFSLGGMAWQAYYKDPEGNIFGIHQTISNPT